MMNQVVLENATCDPLTLLSVRRAIILLLKGKAQIVRADIDRKIRAAEYEMEYPLVIRLVRYVWIPFPRMALSRKGVMLRDEEMCQYCGNGARKRNPMTLDHVMPRSRGGKHEWENVVAACQGCNNRKADRTPSEAEMTLRRQPFTPDRATVILLGRAKLHELQREHILEYARSQRTYRKGGRAETGKAAVSI